MSRKSEEQIIKELEKEINLDDVDFSDLEAQYQVSADFGLDCYVVVDGAPVAPEAKVPILVKVLKKLFNTVGEVVEGDDGIYMPLEDGKLKGYLFVQFKTAAMADAAIAQLNGKKLDQKHRLLVNRLSDIENYGVEGNVADHFDEPQVEEYKDVGYLRLWLQDEAGRDQFVQHYSETVGVYWNKKNTEPEPAIEPRKGFTLTYAKFSPRGTYLFSIHPQGVQLWGGADFASCKRFIHQQVRLIDFSPNEKFMVTLSPVPIQYPDSPREQALFPFGQESNGHKLVIWDLATGQPSRTFALPPHLEGQKEMPWPLVKWSHDDKYCARQGPGALAIYDTDTFQLLDKKLVKVDEIVDFEWAPAPVYLAGPRKEGGDYILSFWTPESTNQTARVLIMQIPERKVIRTVNLFQVSDCKMHWQDEGKFLCVKVDRHTKSKKTFFSNLEFFKLTEKDIPVEKLEMKDVVYNFAWEPKSEKFVTISRMDDGNANVLIPKNVISFYVPEQLKGKNNTNTKYTCVKQVTDKHSNTLAWSPKGRYIVVATIARNNGELEFFDTQYEEDKTTSTSTGNALVTATKHNDLVKLMRNEVFGGMTSLAWDPLGRFVAAWLSIWIHTMENGYKIYEFTGAVVRDELVDQFKEFIWRPRPASLLNAADRKKVRKNLREYSAQFEENDAMEADAATREAILLRRLQLEEWRAYRQPYVKSADQLQHEDQAELIEEIKEEIIEEKEEVIIE